MVYVAVAADLVEDGLLIGTGSAISGQMALILALGQILADIPEGFLVIANFRDKGAGRWSCPVLGFRYVPG
jgi:ZIP family zinc transporter